MSLDHPRLITDEVFPAMMFRYVKYLGNEFSMTSETSTSTSTSTSASSSAVKPQPNSNKPTNNQPKQQPKQQQTQNKSTPAPTKSTTTTTTSTSTSTSTPAYPPNPLPPRVETDEIMPAMMFRLVKYLGNDFGVGTTTTSTSTSTSTSTTSTSTSTSSSVPTISTSTSSQPDLASIVLTELHAIRELLVQQSELHQKLLSEKSKLLEQQDKLNYRINHLIRSIDEETAKGVKTTETFEQQRARASSRPAPGTAKKLIDHHQKEIEAATPTSAKKENSKSVSSNGKTSPKKGATPKKK